MWGLHREHAQQPGACLDQHPCPALHGVFDLGYGAAVWGLAAETAAVAEDAVASFVRPVHDEYASAPSHATPETWAGPWDHKLVACHSRIDAAGDTLVRAKAICELMLGADPLYEKRSSDC